MRKHRIFWWNGNWYFFCALCVATESADQHHGAWCAGDNHVREVHGVDAGGWNRYPTGELSRVRG